MGVEFEMNDDILIFHFRVKGVSLTWDGLDQMAFGDGFQTKTYILNRTCLFFA